MKRTRDVLVQAQQVARLGSFEYFPRTNTLECSAEKKRILGLDPDGPSPTVDAVVELMLPEDRAPALDSFEKFMQGRGPDKWEYRIVRPDGSLRHMSTQAASEFDQQGELQRVIGTTQDITERTVVYTELRENRQKLESVINSSPAVIFTCRYGGDWGATFISAKVTDLLGYSVEECLQPNWWVGTLHPEDRDRVLSELSALSEQSRHSHEYRMATKQGQWRWVSNELILTRDEQGVPTHVTGALLDITERKAAETALREQYTFQRTLLTSAGAAIIATTVEGTITLFNPAAEALLGYRADEMIGKLTPGVFHDPAEVVARAAELSAELGRTIEPGFEVFVLKSRSGELETGEWTYVRKDGVRVPVVLTVSALRNDAGQITGFLGVARDITERKAAEEELKRRLAERTMLLDEVHHRVKNNLTVVASLLSLQQRQTQNAEVAEQLQLSRDRVAAIALVHEQLYGSQRFERIDFKAYLRQLCQNVIESSGARDRKIHFEVSGESFALSLTEAVPCSLLVNELLGNALKHAFPAGRTGRVWVDLSVDSDGARQVRVGDDGVGMAQGAKRDGSMGLKLVQRLTDQLGASLEREAATVGTLYCLRLPKARSEAGHDA